jgi:gamma-glutamyltranspeptidase/glutathione hydrolase
MSLAEAIAAPRLHVEDETLSCEPVIDERVVTRFRHEFSAVHEWPAPNLFFGGVHAVIRTAAGQVDGAGDGRRGGVALVAASSGIREVLPTSRYGEP